MGRVLRPSLLALSAPRAAPAAFPVLALLVLLLGGCTLPPPPQPTATPLRLGALAEYHIPTRQRQPANITAGPDGAVWFTELAVDGHIGRITSAGMLTEFPSSTQAGGITTGPDGALWFTEAYDTSGSVGGGTLGDAIGRITTSGAATAFPVPTPNAYAQGIAAGPDGALWFTETNADKIGQITVAGAITEFAVPTAASEPWKITAGPDGAMWFTEHQTNKIGRITTAGAITEFTIPAGGQPWGITAGPDGALWFTEGFGPVLGRLTVAGVFSNLGEPIPSYNGSGEAPAQPPDPRGITVGPDGALWFTEAGINAIFRVGLSPTAGRPHAPGTAAAVPADPLVGSAAGPGLAWRESERALTARRRNCASSVWL